MCLTAAAALITMQLVAGIFATLGAIWVAEEDDDLAELSAEMGLPG